MTDEQDVLANVTAVVVDRELRKIGETELELEAAQSELNARLDAAKGECEPVIRGLKAKLEGLTARLEASCRDAREGLFAGGEQSLDLGFGRVCWRRLPDRVEPQEGVSDLEVIRRMAAGRRRQFYVTTHRLDRTALNRAASAGLLDEGALADLGLQVVPGGESWVVKTDHEAVREAVGRR